MASAAAAAAKRPLGDLATLRRRAAHCRECPLGALATQTVWGEGAPRARVMVVGEQPGDREDRVGRPFVGPAGRLLDQALQTLGGDCESLDVTNAVKHFKYGLRGKRRMHKTPGQREIAACTGCRPRSTTCSRPASSRWAAPRRTRCWGVP